MPLPSSGQISAANVNVELGRGSSTSLNMNERVVRQLANSVSNANMSPSFSTSLGFNSFYNKSREQVQTLSSGFLVYRNYLNEPPIYDWYWFNNPLPTGWAIDGGSNGWLSVGGDIVTPALDIQFDTTSALRADPSNWAITSSGATYGIRVTMSGVGKNTSGRLLVGFLDRGSLDGDGQPSIYSYTTGHTFSISNIDNTPWSFTNDIVAENFEPLLQKGGEVPWTLSRLKTAGANNYFSITCTAGPNPSSFNNSYFYINAISISVKTQIN